MFRCFPRSPQYHRVLVLEPFLKWAGAFSHWVDLGCGKAEATKAIHHPKAIQRISVDIYDGPDKPEGFIHADIVDYARSHSLAGCAATLLDVIEHFEKADGVSFLSLLESKADAVCVFTPTGFYRQDPTTCPETKDRPEQWHRSGWSPEEFLERGYDVVSFPQMHAGFGGFAAARSNRWRSRTMWRLSLSALHSRGLVDYYQRRLHLIG